MAFQAELSKLSEKLIENFQESLAYIGKKKVVLGLSGGIDSAVSAVLISKAVGSKNIIPIFMPYRTTDPSSFTDAQAVAEKFSLNMDIIDITKPVDAFFEKEESANLLRRGNVMSRMRMITLFDRAAKEDGIVGGSSNKTEIILGYGTWYGDTASSINIIGGLYKKDIYRFANFLEIPESIINKKPSADLWQGQTDEDELGFTYDMADKFLYAIFEENKNKKELEYSFGKEFFDKIVYRIQANSFKRRMPVISGEVASFLVDMEKRFSDFLTNDL